ncbi:DUF262 domain-containing protein (plasmid) [Nostoc sp. C052]|nr:DUF262 domain-containing protein [Nostoc sp. C052]
MLVENKANTEYQWGETELILTNNRMKLIALAINFRTVPNYMNIGSNELAGSWNDTKKSQLIESFLINFPVMPVIIYESLRQSIEVIDGKQRIRTIVEFYSNQLVLRDLKIKSDLNGCTYATLPSQVKRTLNRHSLSLISVTPSGDASPEEIEKLMKTLANRLKLDK